MYWVFSCTHCFVDCVVVHLVSLFSADTGDLWYPTCWTSGVLPHNSLQLCVEINQRPHHVFSHWTFQCLDHHAVPYTWQVYLCFFWLFKIFLYIPTIFWNHSVHLPACPSVTKVSKHYREVFFCTRQQTLFFWGVTLRKVGSVKNVTNTNDNLRRKDKCKAQMIASCHWVHLQSPPLLCLLLSPCNVSFQNVHRLLPHCWQI